MKLAERIQRWWNPAQWRDNHPDEDENGRRRLRGEAAASRSAAEARRKMYRDRASPRTDDGEW
jgi:hypothetical protein